MKGIPIREWRMGTIDFIFATSHSSAPFSALLADGRKVKGTINFLNWFCTGVSIEESKRPSSLPLVKALRDQAIPSLVDSAREAKASKPELRFVLIESRDPEFFHPDSVAALDKALAPLGMKAISSRPSKTALHLLIRPSEFWLVGRKLNFKFSTEFQM